MSYSTSDDAWGNVTTRTTASSTQSMTYDSLDRMTSWSGSGGSSTQNGYDTAGSRTVQRATSGGTTTLTVYAFGLDEDHYDGAGNGQGSTHYYSLGGRQIGELKGSATYLFLTDALGSILATLSSVQGSAGA